MLTSTGFLELLLFLDEEYNKPSRTDYYLMQIAQKLHMMATQKEKPLRDFKIPFEEPKEAKPLTEEEQAARMSQSKAAWFAAVGLGQKNKPQAPGTVPKLIAPRERKNGRR